MGFTFVTTYSERKELLDSLADWAKTLPVDSPLWQLYIMAATLNKQNIDLLVTLSQRLPRVQETDQANG